MTGFWFVCREMLCKYYSSLQSRTMSQEQHKFQIALLVQKYNYSFWCNASTSLATISFFCSALLHSCYGQFCQPLQYHWALTFCSHQASTSLQGFDNFFPRVPADVVIGGCAVRRNPETSLLTSFYWNHCIDFSNSQCNNPLSLFPLGLLHLITRIYLGNNNC